MTPSKRPKPLYHCKVGNKSYLAYTWTGHSQYPCLHCPFHVCSQKPADAPKCPATLNRFHKNLRWEVKTTPNGNA